MKTPKTIAELKPEDVLQVYSGRQDGCRCGCLGIYRCPRVNAPAAAKNRGYAIDEEDINDVFVRRVLSKIQKADERNPLSIADSGYAGYAETSGRVYTVYVLPEIELVSAKEIMQPGKCNR